MELSYYSFMYFTKGNGFFNTHFGKALQSVNYSKKTHVSFATASHRVAFVDDCSDAARCAQITSSCVIVLLCHVMIIKLLIVLLLYHRMI